ncbi:MAG: FAD-containing oxidoreductase [Candidatus Eisenbacteria bacterium]|nr:FAD-containing oxidoreductase [Candidatus Eisenbacteria bacterium]
MPSAAHYDAIVIGAGQAGGPLAKDLAAAGRRTLLVEQDVVGGSCVNYGCTPTKTMIASARVAHLARRGPDYGIATGELAVDLAKVRERKRGIVKLFRESNEKGYAKAENLDLTYGAAAFADRHVIEIDPPDGPVHQAQADLIFINTGARPVIPPIDGLDDAGHLDSTSIQELDRAPAHLAIIGGGYIALEFGQMFRRFGSRVTIIERNGRLIHHEDEDISETMTAILEEDGIEVLCRSEVRKIAVGGKGGIHLAVQGPDSTSALDASHLLVAAGRRPNIDSLNLEAAGIKTDTGGSIEVDERLETNVAGVYALGDVKGGPAFTHISYDDYRVIRDNLLEGREASTARRILTYTIFTDPQLGRVGLSEAEARRRGLPIRVGKLPMSKAARALEVDETRGFMKAVVHAETGEILGASILGIDAGEVAAVVQTAMMGGLSHTRIRDAVYAHPTLAESLNSLFARLE